MPEATPLTLELLRDQFGFKIYDLGDFWSCEREDMYLMQPKFQILEGVRMPFICPPIPPFSKVESLEYAEQLESIYFQAYRRNIIAPSQTTS